MKNSTICSAAIMALKKADKPLNLNELLFEIESKNLYIFKAKNPSNVLKSTLRKHTYGLSSKMKMGKPFFIHKEDGKYCLFENF